jgi:hypothetical protein
MADVGGQGIVGYVAFVHMGLGVGAVHIGGPGEGFLQGRGSGKTVRVAPAAGNGPVRLCQG